MDMMIPYLGQITRLQLESKGAFHIAGVKDSNAQRIEREKRRKRELLQKEILQGKKPKSDKTAITEDENGEKHLDTWA
ncbi:MULTISPECIES: hypothetical protein [Pseudoalteromonas]|uniref:Uncharacterized protein n=1 Tax=Pseudoalteromonas haloplanktis TaxID=228 RepID=A0ABU1B6I1_PSEHA|nr:MULTISPECIES: hypothetical protein [Pseudoalteromonas]MCF6146912.1 hypothetical protein [Pseudoalteromonas mariniglutinosa NCIMB 1770]MDQ9090013.1 hypothetical protein [Pseudoalteromonas haloplanktis]TMN73363.1 hypothetical protein CWB85_04400 [Pseudoalteromonas sp. S1727]